MSAPIPAANNARCSCGALAVETRAEAQFIIACHCRACQRRSGGAFGAGAYFDRAAAEVLGDPREYARTPEVGGTFRSYFCQTCGTSVFWTIDSHPELIGIALGTFETPLTGIAVHSLYERTKLDWIALDAASLHSPAGYPDAA